MEELIAARRRRRPSLRCGPRCTRASTTWSPTPTTGSSGAGSPRPIRRSTCGTGPLAAAVEHKLVVEIARRGARPRSRCRHLPRGRRQRRGVAAARVADHGLAGAGASLGLAPDPDRRGLRPARLRPRGRCPGVRPAGPGSGSDTGTGERYAALLYTIRHGVSSCGRRRDRGTPEPSCSGCSPGTRRSRSGGHRRRRTPGRGGARPVLPVARALRTPTSPTDRRHRPTRRVRRRVPRPAARRVAAGGARTRRHRRPPRRPRRRLPAAVRRPTSSGTARPRPRPRSCSTASRTACPSSTATTSSRRGTSPRPAAIRPPRRSRSRRSCTMGSSSRRASSSTRRRACPAPAAA